MGLGKFENDPRLQRALTGAYRRRIRVGRLVLGETKHSGLKLGLYQVIVRDSSGLFSCKIERLELRSAA